jgi:hypothetical protein
VPCPNTFPITEFVSSSTQLKFQKVKNMHGRKYVEDIIFYTFGGTFGESARQTNQTQT